MEVLKLADESRAEGERVLSTQEILKKGHELILENQPGYNADIDIAEGGENGNNSTFKLQTKNVRPKGKKNIIKEAHVNNALRQFDDATDESSDDEEEGAQGEQKMGKLPASFKTEYTDE